MSDPHKTSNPESLPDNDNTDTYRPQSPDLSAFIAQRQQSLQFVHPSYQGSSHPLHQGAGAGSGSGSGPGGRPGPSVLTGLPGGVSFPHRGSYDASPYFSPQRSSSVASQGQGYFGQAATQYAQPRGEILPGREIVTSPTSRIPVGAGAAPFATQSPVSLPSGANPFGVTKPPPQHAQQQTQSYPLGQPHNPEQQNLTATAINKSLPTESWQPQQPRKMPARRKRGHNDDTDDSGDRSYDGNTGAVPKSKGTRKRKSDNTSHQSWAAMRSSDDPGPSQGIDVKTKFPVARIKRIMQADEDVGKVAQAAPTAVSKALELFMITMVTKAASEAKDRGSKRVTAVHLKQAVAKDQTFDFLQDIIEKVPDPTEKKGGPPGSEDVNDGAGAPKKKRAPRGKKKTGSDED